ncbi:L-threonylcarbamoyladenylate synthase [Thiovibrio sp. JS02]
MSGREEEAEHIVTDQDLARAREVLLAGGVVAYPTETYYGLAVDPLNQAALSRLFALKRRPPDKPVLVLVENRIQLSRLVAEVPPPFEILMGTLWPGALTLVFPGVATLPAMLTGYSGTVGVRLSSHPVARRLVQVFGAPITATSANFSGQPAAVDAAGVIDQIGPDVDFVLDGGVTPGGKGSTIIGCEEGEVRLLREGVIPFADILALVAGH